MSTALLTLLFEFVREQDIRMRFREETLREELDLVWQRPAI